MTVGTPLYVSMFRLRIPAEQSAPASGSSTTRSEDHKISHDRIPPELANGDVAERLRNAAVSVRAR
jgi:hypothetical protein